MKIQEKYQEEIINKVKEWLEKVIIGLNLCPFAREPYENQRVRLKVYFSKTLKETVSDFQKEVQYLNKHSNKDTSLLIYPRMANILEFSRLVQACEEWIFINKLFKQYQIVFFHPNAILHNEINTAKNLVIQAPYPILHLLRAPDVERLGSKTKMDIQQANDKKLSSLTPAELEHYFKLIKTKN